MFKIVLVAALFALASAGRRVPTLDGRIVGGNSATIEQFPHQISLRYYGSHICGGSIIDSTHILTAAHCTAGSSASQLSIRAGSTSQTSGGQTISVRRITDHPSYNDRTMDSDVSVLELASPLRLGSGVQPISLSSSDPTTGSNAVCSGWGDLGNGQSPDRLMSVTVQIISRATCNQRYNPSGYQITNTMICGGVTGGGKDACQGDSGGPLVVNGQLAGVVSWGIGCADARYPGVYSNVAALRSFIDANH